MSMNVQYRVIFGLLAAALIACLGLMPQAQAQEYSESHLDAAKKVMEVSGATKRLDVILPEMAQAAKTGLIGARPDKEEEISNTVDSTAIELAPRRGDLENEIAQVYAKLFTEDELTTMYEFYSSDTGKKLLSETPILFREIDRAAKVWRVGLGRDLQEAVRTKLKEQGIE